MACELQVKRSTTNILLRIAGRSHMHEWHISDPCSAWNSHFFMSCDCNSHGAFFFWTQFFAFTTTDTNPIHRGLSSLDLFGSLMAFWYWECFQSCYTLLIWCCTGNENEIWSWIYIAMFYLILFLRHITMTKAEYRLFYFCTYILL